MTHLKKLWVVIEEMAKKNTKKIYSYKHQGIRKKSVCRYQKNNKRSTLLKRMSYELIHNALIGIIIFRSMICYADLIQ